MRRTAVVVGCDGQDGRLLWDALARDGWGLVGIARTRTRSNLPGWRARVRAGDERKVDALIARLKPREVYYLAAYHHPAEERPLDTASEFRAALAVHAEGLVNFLEAIRRRSRSTRLFYAASCRVFGSPAGVQDERTPIAPVDVYGATKAAGLHACRLYRGLGVFASTGILYNHESPLRGPNYVSRKLVRGAADAAAGKGRMRLGDLKARVDWGWAPDFVRAMRLILRRPRPDDYVIATGRTRSVLDFARAAARCAGLDWRDCFVEDRSVLRHESPRLAGNPAKLKRETGWRPTVSFEEMVAALYAAEVASRK